MPRHYAIVPAAGSGSLIVGDSFVGVENVIGSASASNTITGNDAANALTGGEAPDILNYATNHPAFPHDTTADQAFDEDQFESYRKLGFHIGDELFGAIRIAAEAANVSFTTAAFVAQVSSMAIAPKDAGNAA